ncbi:MAG: carbohydrate-binding protein [Actinomycetota bacterium]|nr:carbohydrate-binding protein [Actinomycetota bacterium]
MFGGVAATLVAAVLTPLLASSPAAADPVGAGSYTTTRPAGGAAPTACAGISTNPRQSVTANAPAGPVPTNDWWSSLLWKRYDCAYSEPLAAHPMSYDTVAGGLAVSYNTTPAISGTATGVGEYHFPHTTDFTLGVAGLNSPDAKVDGWSDWTVTPYWSDGTRTLKTTIGHGLPFVYARTTGGNAALSFPSTPTVWSNSGSAVGFTVRGHDYVAYAPTGATWTVSGTSITSTLAGKGYFSVALLPTTPTSTATDRTNLLNSYGQYAHAHVTGSTVSWTYDQAASTVRATYSLATQALEGTNTNTVMSLYPHQYRNLAGGTPIAQTYVSPRGAMRNLVGVRQFTTAIKYTGVLPEIPAAGMSSADAATLGSYLDSATAGDPFAGFNNDTYWTGKALGRAARLAEIADQLGRTAQRDAMLRAIKTRLTDWFTATTGKTERVFFYDRAWGTLVGYPASYGSDTDLNDHHFHYAYYIAAAATLAKFDPAWASQSQYGGMVDLLIRDSNNYRRGDTMFPFLRNFDVYAGHDWASGHGAFGAGNNQESSSEGQNFASGLIQWGQATGNTAIRDAGLFIWTTQGQAIQEYWFDSRDVNFPSQFQHSTVGMVWGDGGAYSTWFTAEPEMIQGINMLPITGGSLYLGYDPAYIRRNLQELNTNNGGPPTVWQDVIWSFQALADPDTGLSSFRDNSGYTPEEGESKAHTFHWLRSLSTLGNVDTSVTSNHPLYAVFVKNDVRTYVASNITASPITVTFSNGTTLNVPAGRTATTGSVTWSGGNATGGGTPTSSPTPTATASPTPTATATSSPTPTATAPTRSAYTRIEAESFNSQSGVSTETTTDTGGGQNIGWIANGDWTAYDNVDFGSGGTGVSIRIASGAASTGNLEIRLDSLTNAPVATVPVSSTGGWQTWATRSAAMSTVTGTHKVYVRAQSATADEFVNVNWLNFTQPAGRDAYSTIQAESYDGQAGTQLETTADTGGGQNVAYISNGDWLRYNGVNFGSTSPTTFNARVASGAAAGVSGIVEVRLDSTTGPLVGSFSVANTGGWQSWRTVPAGASGATGTHDVYLRFVSGQPADFMNLNWFSFSR